MEAKKEAHPVGDRSVAEAFSWRVGTMLKDDGLAGLVMPGTSLVNLNSRKYRSAFFTTHQVFRITNFANLRRFLFGGRSEAPAATLVYAKVSEERTKAEIIHYGPFLINQIPQLKGAPWALVINEDEIQLIPAQEAEKGETTTWKLALWGSYRDRRSFERLRWLFPTTLETYCELQGWGTHLPQQGLELRADAGEGTNRAVTSDKLRNTKAFSLNRYNTGIPYRFSLPDSLLIPNEKLYLRVRGGSTALRINKAPHILISKGWDFIIYSDVDFIVPPQHMGISIGPGEGLAKCPTEEAAAAHRSRLKALCLYLNSTVVKYYLFFRVPEWGIDRRRDSVVVSEVRKIPTPVFTEGQVVHLATLYDRLSREEQAGQFSRRGHQQGSLFDELGQDPGGRDTDHGSPGIEELQRGQQAQIDDMIMAVCQVPTDIQRLASDFVNNHLLLNQDKKGLAQATRIPTPEEFTQYAEQLQTEINDFLMGGSPPKVAITWSRDLAECAIELPGGGKGAGEIGYTVQEGTVSYAQVLEGISADLRQRISQWTYIQRGLRLYDGRRIYLYKSMRLTNWTRTQAMHDAADIIAYSIQATAL